METCKIVVKGSQAEIIAVLIMICGRCKLEELLSWCKALEWGYLVITGSGPLGVNFKALRDHRGAYKLV